MRRLAEEIRHKRRLLEKAVEVAGGFQNEVVLHLSREIDALIINYMRLEAVDHLVIPLATGENGS